MTAHRSSFGADNKGAVLAESAIALPLILVIFATIFAAGSTLFKTQELETASRDAARYLARTQTTAADETAARNLAVYANTAGTGARRVSGLTTGNIGITYVTISNPVLAATGERAYRGTDPLKLVRVDVTWTSSAGAMWGFFGGSPVTYHAIHQERVIGD